MPLSAITLRGAVRIVGDEAVDAISMSRAMSADRSPSRADLEPAHALRDRLASRCARTATRCRSRRLASAAASRRGASPACDPRRRLADARGGVVALDRSGRRSRRRRELLRRDERAPVERLDRRFAGHAAPRIASTAAARTSRHRRSRPRVGVIFVVEVCRRLGLHQRKDLGRVGKRSPSTALLGNCVRSRWTGSRRPMS